MFLSDISQRFQSFVEFYSVLFENKNGNDRECVSVEFSDGKHGLKVF